MSGEKKKQCGTSGRSLLSVRLACDAETPEILEKSPNKVGSVIYAF